MYKSPIEIMLGEVKMSYENEIMKAVQHYGINVDKEELFKALRNEREQYDKGYQDGFTEALDKFRILVREVDLTRKL